MTEIGESKTDAAALGGSVVAVAMTMFTDEGPYDAFGAGVGLTLWVLILGYMGFHRRNLLQSVAIAMVFGVISVPIWGYFAETSQKDTASNVSEPCTLMAWAIIASTALAMELIVQRYRSPLWERIDAFGDSWRQEGG